MRRERETVCSQISNACWKGLKWLTYALLLSPTVRALAGTQGNAFPVSESFATQRTWIDNLPNGHSRACDVVRAVKSQSNPFEASLSETPAGVSVNVHSHRYHGEHGVVTRRTRTYTAGGSDSIVGSASSLPARERQETEIMIGGAGTNGPILHRFALDSSGNWIPTGREQRPIEELGRGLSSNREGVVFEAIAENALGFPQRCYGHDERQSSAAPR